MSIRNEKFAPNGEGILITGCSSGIGRACAIGLARRGFTVFATVRRPADAEALRQIGLPDLIPVCPLDLTHPEHIPTAVDFVRAELGRRGKGLYAILQNAGGGSFAPVELMDPALFRAELETRLVGPLALLQACLPMIRDARGRILWIVTPALLPVRYVASIHACDFAANCLVRTLNLELKRWNIPAVMIRCGGIQTAAVTRTGREIEDALRTWPERGDFYRDALQKELDDLAVFDQKRTPPEAVADVVYRALVAKRPRRRYSVGHMARLAAAAENLPQNWIDWLMEKRA